MVVEAITRFYLKSGIVLNCQYYTKNDEDFYVKFSQIAGKEDLSYKSDYLVREIEEELVDLFDRFRDLYFSDLEEYYRESYTLPLGLCYGGQNSSLPIDKEWFLKTYELYVPIIKNLDRHIYVMDCWYLISTVQNLLNAIEYCFTQYYVQISQIEIPKTLLNEGNDIYQQSSQECMKVSFLVETFFTKIYSILDLMVKIVYELENKKNEFKKITKLQSSDRLWGDRKKLSFNNLKNTIFEDCDLFKMVECLRNEVVHNGSWESRSRIFVRIVDGNATEKYMLFPDLTEGRLNTVKNRKHFFSTGVKVNDMLVSIHDEFYRRLHFTLKAINNKYSK